VAHFPASSSTSSSGFGESQISVCDYSVSGSDNERCTCESACSIRIFQPGVVGLLGRIGEVAGENPGGGGSFTTKAVTDPQAAVAFDVAALRAIPALVGAWLLSGLVYDVATGLLEIVAPAPIRTALD